LLKSKHIFSTWKVKTNLFKINLFNMESQNKSFQREVFGINQLRIACDAQTPIKFLPNTLYQDIPIKP